MTFRKVNIYSDVSGRTLLALYRLKVMRYLMPVDNMPLYVTFRQGCGIRRFYMNSIERKEARYQRRKAAREQKKSERMAVANDFEQVFSYENLYRAYKCCRRGVSWKSSVQRYIATAPLMIAQTRKRLHNGTYRSPGFFEFDLYERGKKRHIRSTIIGERVVQRCLCDNSLIPALAPTFIYDNGASLKNKGYDFAFKRITKHLRDHYRRYGNEGYILLFDFSKFFDNISHKVTKELFEQTFTDDRIIKLATHFVDAFGDKGLGLGSQISQILALASANRLDHYIKEVLRIKGYGRYMDDGYLIHPSKEYLQKCLEDIEKVCDMLEITLNKRKTQLVKISHGFVWLKARIYLTNTGKVIKKIYKRSVTQMRRKLKILKKLMDMKRINCIDVYNSWQSWRGYARRFNAWQTIRSMGDLYNKLFVYREVSSYVY